MRYYHVASTDGSRLLVHNDQQVYDLTAARPRLRTFTGLLEASSVTAEPIDTLAEGLLDDAKIVDEEAVVTNSTTPVRPEEVWAAGVTYWISEEAREVESGMPEIYLDVYDSERPEVFFKATPSRTVGPGEAIGIRGDSDWDVPEPELAVVLYDQEVVGYTVGNDVSSRSIEGANPLYLPQAKIYDRCCAIGPCVRSAASIDDPHDLEIRMNIERDGDLIYDEATSTTKMERTVEELVAYYTRHNVVPDVSVLLTGTSLVPDETFTLRENDVVEIGIEGIGTLRNSVVTV